MDYVNSAFAFKNYEDALNKSCNYQDNSCDYNDRYLLRCVSFRDDFDHSIFDFLKNAQFHIDEFTYEEGFVNYVTDYSFEFDAIVVSGNDVRRVAEILKYNEPILRHKPKISLMKNACSQLRSDALLAGFDDVFDLATMIPAEARARLNAIEKHYKMRRAWALDALACRYLNGKTADDQVLSDREKTILTLLLGRSGHCFPHDVVLTEVSKYHQEVSSEDLRLAILSIRKKLPENFKIECDRSGSYRIFF